VAREFFWIAVTQPLLPIFYLVGHRMGGRRANGTPVILVHGYGQNRVNMIGLAVSLHRSNCGPIYGFNYDWSAPIGRSATSLRDFIERVCSEHGTRQVAVVAHSLGGVVTLEYARVFGNGRLARCVTIASPYAGVQWPGPLVGVSGAQLRHGSDYFVARDEAVSLTTPWLSIASTHDNIVHPPRTSSLESRGAQDLVVPHMAHLTLLFSKTVLRATGEFLRAESTQHLAAPSAVPCETVSAQT
jgi:pimeloyl-ACP methyl ester carboxylesterase